MIDRAREKILSMIGAVEAMPMAPSRWLLALAAIIVIRHFLEQVSGQLKTFYFVPYLISYPLAYIAPLLALAIVLAVMSRERIARVTKLMLFAWLLTLLPPLLDLLVTRAGEQPALIGYLLTDPAQLGTAFLNLLNPLYTELRGATTGIRIEAAVGCVLGAAYVQLKCRSWARSIAALVLVYVVSFFFFALPSILTGVTASFGATIENVYQLFFIEGAVHRAFGGADAATHAELSAALIDLFVIVPLLAAWYALYDRRRFRSMVRSIEPVQVIYHTLLTFAGMVLGTKLLAGSRGLLLVVRPFDAYATAGILAASFFAALTAGALRNAEAGQDGRESPLRIRDWRILGAIYFALASLFAFSVSFVAFTYVLAFVGTYYLYYAHPTRLGRFYPISGFLVAGAGLFSLELGFCAYAATSAALWIPRTLVILLLAVPTLALSARDVWSTGPALADEDASGWNLALLMGERNARILSGAATFVAALLPALLLRVPSLLIPGALVGAVALISILRAPPRIIPRVLIVLMAASFAAGMAMDAIDTPALRSDLPAGAAALEAPDERGPADSVEEYVTEEQALLNEGVALFERGDNEGAIETFRAALSIDPNYIQAHVNIGTAYLRGSRIREAVDAFERALELSPDNVMARVGLGQAYKVSGDLRRAAGELKMALRLDPRNPRAAFTLALVYHDLGETEDELEMLKLTASTDPENSIAQSRLGDFYLANRMYAEAVVSFRAAIGGRTPVERLHAKLAEAYYMTGDLVRAEEEIRNEIRGNPASAPLYANLARILADKGKTKEAMDEMQVAIDMTEDSRVRSQLEKELEALRKEARN